MIFVIGSAFQGKTEFVKEHFHISEKDMIDGRSCDVNEAFHARAISHFESLVYRLMKKKQPIDPFVERILAENKNSIIISTEIGCGLVPVDSFEREYRETVGRSCCQIAKDASQVYRVQCGIASKIYDCEAEKSVEKKKVSDTIKVYILRHSITKGNLEKRYVGSTDEPLCKEGIDLAKSKNLPYVEKVYTSPLLRCKETADILYPQIEKAIFAGLRETDFGDFEYKNYDELNGNPDYQRWIDSNAKSGFPNGESLEAANSRVREVFQHIIKDALQNQYQSIAIVTHGGTIMGIMSQFSNEKKDYFEWQVKNCEGFLLEIDGGSSCYQ